MIVDAAPVEPPVENTPPATPEAPKTRAPRTQRARTEFELAGDIQAAFRGLPSNTARSRVWEYITNWLGEEFPPPQQQTGPLTLDDLKKN